MLDDPGWSRVPDDEGVAVRQGVSLAYEVFGAGRSPTVLLMPTWSIIPSRFWRAQVGHLSRRFRVVVFDGRGSGRSSRPVGAAAYTDAQYAADAVAVLDATGAEQAVLVSLSCGAAWSAHVAADHPERVLGVLAIAPSCGFDVSTPGRDHVPWDARLPSHDGWEMYNKHFWLEGDYEGFLEFFFARMYSEPHSTKQIEDSVRWGRQVPPATLVDTTAGRLGCDGAVSEPLEPVCRRIRCPVTVVHGTHDRVRPQAIGERYAELTGGSLVLLDGAGHGPQARHPVVINRLITAFVDRICPTPVRTTWTRAARRSRRALYLSSPIGLGHARRDTAIATELRALVPDLQIDWLAQSPVTRVLADRGERIHPASAQLVSESGHVEGVAGEHDLHAFQAIRSMDAVLVDNFMVFSDVVDSGDYDLVVADEAWDVDYFLHENPELKRFAFAWLTDFVGWLPMPSGGQREEALTTDLNAEMIEQRARFRRVRDRSVFVGSPEDVVDLPFGEGLPTIRAWTEENFDFAGYVTGMDVGVRADVDDLRRRLGAGRDEKLCVVAVGGSAVGGPLLHRIMDAVPLARQLVPELRFLFVTGPRIDPRSVPRRAGVRVTGYVPDLDRCLAACDVAVVQGGLTTCMELAALRKPFVYVPLRNHFEQEVHVRHRLRQYGAGRCLDYEHACRPEALAAALVAELGTQVAYRPVEDDGAARAAGLLAELL